MKPETLSILLCPVCRDRLQVTVVKAVTRNDRLRDGIIQCVGCKQSFPVLNWVPRLLPNHALTVDEHRALEAMNLQSDTNPSVVEEERLDSAELQQQLEERMRKKLYPSDLSDKLRERQEEDVDYRLRHNKEKGKFLRTANAYLGYTPSRILDVGGGQGGALATFNQYFNPEMAVLLDIDPDWVEMAWLLDPDTDVIRADATRMPLADGCMDFVFSSATLEHIEDWKSAVHEMVRVGNQGLLCYNPNAGFPYDFGHLDTPLVTWFPKSIALKVAHFFHRLRRTGRTLDSIRAELAATFYIHRRAVVRELTLCGVEVDNAFGEFMKQTVQESYHIRGRRIFSFFRLHPNLLAVFTKALVLIGAEPNVYLFYRRREKNQEDARQKGKRYPSADKKRLSP
jgi:ubiquinone/menaquinone biosynthesis C-methylase UbiE/uncharacterized protein YbaR (Trm112 family)